MRFFIANPVSLLLLFIFASLGSYGQNPGKTAYIQAENLRRQNRCEEAISKYDEAQKLEPGNYRYYFAEGKCHYKLKAYDLAIAAFEETVGVKADFTPAYSLIAKIYTGRKEYQKAIGYYDQAFNYEKNTKRKVQYKLLIVQMLVREGNTAEARSHIADAKKVDPEDPNVLYYDGKISNQDGDYSNAKAAMLIATSKLQDAPPAQSAKYYYELGYAYNKLGDYENAKRSWEKANFGSYKKLIAQQLSSNSPGYFYKMAVSYYISGEYTESQSQINKALELQASFSAAYILMGKIAQKQGNMSQAINHYKSAVGMESNPERKALLELKISMMQLDAGDYSGALSSANNLLGSNDSERVRYIKAQAQYKLGQYGQAIGTLESLLSNPSIDAKSKAQYSFILGMAAKKSGNTEKAKEAFKNAMGGSFKPAAKNELDALLGKS